MSWDQCTIPCEMRWVVGVYPNRDAMVGSASWEPPSA